MQRTVPPVLAALILAACATSPSVQEQPATGAVVPTTPAPAAPAAPAAPVAPVAPVVTTERGVFTLTRGADTLATERFTRTPTQLDVDFATRAQGRFAYTATLQPDATVSRLEARFYRAGSAQGAAPSQQSVATFQGDTILAEERREGGEPQSTRIATQRNAIPYLNPSMSLVEQIVRRARAVGGGGAGPVQVPTFIASSGAQTMTATITFIGADSATIALANAELRLRVDDAGRLLGARMPAQNLVVERTDTPVP
jgi:hypothetical protein